MTDSTRSDPVWIIGIVYIYKPWKQLGENDNTFNVAPQCLPNVLIL